MSFRIYFHNDRSIAVTHQIGGRKSKAFHTTFKNEPWFAIFEDEACKAVGHGRTAEQAFRNLARVSGEPIDEDL